MSCHLPWTYWQRLCLKRKSIPLSALASRKGVSLYRHYAWLSKFTHLILRDLFHWLIQEKASRDISMQWWRPSAVWHIEPEQSKKLAHEWQATRQRCQCPLLETSGEKHFLCGSRSYPLLLPLKHKMAQALLKFLFSEWGQTNELGSSKIVYNACVSLCMFRHSCYDIPNPSPNYSSTLLGMFGSW